MKALLESFNPMKALLDTPSMLHTLLLIPFDMDQFTTFGNDIVIKNSFISF
jgi:hypothetical protein